VVVTDPTQVTEIKKSRELRLKIRAVRVAAEKTRKELKEDSLRTGKAIDGMNNVLLYLIDPIEKRLGEQETIAERMEQERKDNLRREREALLLPLGVDPSFYKLGDMPEATFKELLASITVAKEQREAAARKAEEDRIAAEKARQAEEARMRAENERLRKEAQEREAAAAAERKKLADEQAKKDAAARAEREKLEAQARKEREAREKLERENAEREAAEKKRQQDEAKAQRKAARAPDKAKLLAVAQAVRAIQVPEVKSPEAARTARIVANTLETAASAIESLVAEMDA